MGKIVLGSGGIFFENESDPILDHIISLVDEGRRRAGMKAVFVPTAGHDSHDDEEIVTDYFTRHGFVQVTHLYLTDPTLTDDFIRETILSASVIYVRGGNLQFLMNTWNKTNAPKYFKEAYANGVVLAGHSSGAMCWCQHGYDDCGPDDRFMFIDPIGIMPFIVCPHFEDWPSFLHDVKMQELDGLGIDNDIAVSFVDGHYTIIDSHRNPRHSAYLLPAYDDYQVHDLQKEHLNIGRFTYTEHF